MRLIDFFFPQNIKCVICGKEDGGFALCEECYSKLPFINGKVCEKCGIGITSGKVCLECKANNHTFERVFSIFEYRGKLRYLILALKQNGEKYIAKPLSKLVLEYFKKLDIPFDLIIPMPIHPNRLKSRGFNQCDLLLDEVKSYYGRVYDDVLIRKKDTPHQTGLSRDNRKVNLMDAFKVTDKSKVKGKIVLLFDDIYTTGTSLNECAKVLLKSGASKVYCLCLARTPINNEKYLNGIPENDDMEKYIQEFVI